MNSHYSQCTTGNRKALLAKGLLTANICCGSFSFWPAQSVYLQRNASSCSRITHEPLTVVLLMCSPLAQRDISSCLEVILRQSWDWDLSKYLKLYGRPLSQNRS